ncbi:hypothetical protein LOTGIDRAFT_167619 [Lottia gigantea]|uniref:Uncharacterized protein n=1 Tax=Lottia gigantea TaxID=225164 RepID=V4BAB1_LOTGI|nr:hypothetical protein LOTGIDRAFT_167619 [Lottia gigantea]ESO85869.1 hypothetical protein LOTGIDRAFT_167619 [Lottia gigantea]
MSLPTVTTYTGYKDDHVRNWSYSHHLKNTQRQNDMDFYSTDEDVQQRYLESRRNENQRNEETSQMTTREDLQDDTPEKRGSTVVVVHKEVVHNSQTTNGFRDSDDDGGITIENTKILVEGSQAVYQSQTPSDDRIESKDTEIRINAVDAAPDNEGTQPSSPITQRPRNAIDPPAPSRISVTEIETFTIDAPEENVTRNESNEFILQDEGEVVMEYRNANRAQNDNHPTTEHIDHKEASHDHSEGKPGLAYPSYLEAAAADYDASQTGSMIVYHEDEGNTLQHITNGIARGNGYEQADEDSINIGASSSPQPTPLIADTEYQPQSTSDMQKESQPTVKSSFQNKSKWGVSSSFLGRLREKIRPVSKTPNLRDSPPEVAVQQEPSQEPEPAYESKPQNNDQSSNFAIQSENLKDEGPHRRQWDRPDEDLLPPPTYNSEAPEAINRPPTPPSPFIGPPPLAPPPPPIPQSSPYPKHVSFANGEVEISSHL